MILVECLVFDIDIVWFKVVVFIFIVLSLEY